MNENRRAGELLDTLDPATTTVENATDVARLTEAVEIARAHGRSWTRIATALGISRQAARQRFAHKTTV